jgi:cobalt-zinc-cadmium resistance protein CzcA
LFDVEPDALALAQYDLQPLVVLQTVEALRSGVRVATTYRGPRDIPVMVRLEAPLDPLSLRSTPITTAKGVVALERVAQLRNVVATSQVQHDDGKRRVVVGFNVRGGDLQSVVGQAQAAVARDLVLPSGFSLHWGGQLEVLQAAQARMKIVVPLALLAILALLFLAFRHVRPVLVIATQVPFASVGGIIALSLRDMPLSIAAIVGFVALSGVAVMNGVVLLSETLKNQRHGASPRVAAHDAAISRARPVVMTALVAMLGFVPMMLSQGVGAEVQRPLATVVVAGLVTSTLLTLLVLPVLYPLTYRRRSTDDTRTATVLS